MRRRHLLMIVACLVGSACSGGRDEEGGVEGNDPLVEVGRVVLEETPDDPIVGIDFVGRRPGGGYIIADRHAGHVRLFDSTGRQVRVVGMKGEGPGELDEPSAAVEFPDGRLFVLQRASPRLTLFPPDTAPSVSNIHGQYGFWAERSGSGFFAGVATRDTRFARFDDRGVPVARFGARDPAIAATPFWIYFASDHAAVLEEGEMLAVNTSLSPTIRLFDSAGDSVDAWGDPPPSWVPISAPPVLDLSAPGNRERIEEWARSFTVVRQIAAIADSLLAVEYGRYDPQESDPYRILSSTVDVYSKSGEKIVEGLTLPGPLVGGGDELLALVAEPPDPWTISLLRWRGVRD